MLMLIIDQKLLVSRKVESILNGYCAYVESKELSEKVKKELVLRNIPFFEDVTEKGTWFIPGSMH